MAAARKIWDLVNPSKICSLNTLTAIIDCDALAPLRVENERMFLNGVDAQETITALRTRVAELEKSHAELFAGIGRIERDKLRTRITALETANKALGADKARLDWLEENRIDYLGYSSHPDMGGNQWSLRTRDRFNSRQKATKTARAAIDAAIATGGKET